MRIEKDPLKEDLVGNADLIRIALDMERGMHWDSEESRSKFRRWLAVFVGVMLFACVTTGVYLLTRPSDPPAVVEEFDYPRERWYDLLERKPTMIDWEDSDGTILDVGDGRIVVSTNENAMIGLGTIKHPAFTLQVDIRQNGWQGRSGVFFGYAERSGDETVNGVRVDRVATFHAIELIASGEQFSLQRRRYRALTTVDGKRLYQHRAEASFITDMPKAEVQSLQLVFGPTYGLSAVKWGERSLPSLATSDVVSAGEFGVFNRSSSSMYYQPQILVAK